VENAQDAALALIEALDDHDRGWTGDSDEQGFGVPYWQASLIEWSVFPARGWPVRR